MNGMSLEEALEGIDGYLVDGEPDFLCRLAMGVPRGPPR